MVYDVLESFKKLFDGNEHNIDTTEIELLAKGLDEKGIKYEMRDIWDGKQIICAGWDAICHRGSYGGDEGLLEIMGNIVNNEDDDVEGFLTAKDILERV